MPIEFLNGYRKGYALTALATPWKAYEQRLRVVFSVSLFGEKRDVCRGAGIGPAPRQDKPQRSDINGVMRRIATRRLARSGPGVETFRYCSP